MNLEKFVSLCHYLFFHFSLKERKREGEEETRFDRTPRKIEILSGIVITQRWLISIKTVGQRWKEGSDEEPMGEWRLERMDELEYICTRCEGEKKKKASEWKSRAWERRAPSEPPINTN